MRFRKRDIATAGDHILSLDWMGDTIVATPVTGPILLIDPRAKSTIELPAHGLGNSPSAVRDGSVVTCGFDGSLRFHSAPWQDARTVKLSRGLIERARWSPDGLHLAAAQGKILHILDQSGNPVCAFSDHLTSVSDLAWNPANPREIATVCGGGARMWRLGESEPFARFDWGGASLTVAWSPDGRWIVTGDQTPSVHLYDFTRDYPLHIQGYETKVKAFDFSPDSTLLATGGAPMVTIWDCTGESGPEDTTPAQLPFHRGDVEAIAWSPDGSLLASGDIIGRIVFSDSSRKPVSAFEGNDAISAFAWSPDSRHLAAGDALGYIFVFSSIS